jgi:hypothetical protein
MPAPQAGQRLRSVGKKYNIEVDFNVTFDEFKSY